MDSNYEITLSFDYFNLSRSSDCSDDYVEVRDGQFDTSELVGKFCGADIPEPVTSDSWAMRLTFKSSGKTKYPGFKASYKTKSKFVMVKVTFGFLASFFIEQQPTRRVCTRMGPNCKLLFVYPRRAYEFMRTR